MLETMITELTEDSTSLERKLLSEKDEWNLTRASLEESIRQKNTQIEEGKKLTTMLKKLLISKSRSHQNTWIDLQSVILTPRKKKTSLKTKMKQLKK